MKIKNITIILITLLMVTTSSYAKSQCSEWLFRDRMAISKIIDMTEASTINYKLLYKITTIGNTASSKLLDSCTHKFNNAMNKEVFINNEIFNMVFNLLKSGESFTPIILSKTMGKGYVLGVDKYKKYIQSIKK